MTADARFGGLSRVSVAIVWAAVIVGLIHHTDHVLRVDHSGWPFRQAVNPFTFSLLAYPILIFTLFGPARLFWLRWSLFLTGTAFTLWAHTKLETPSVQYAMWAHDRSLDAAAGAVHNLPDVQSPLLGVLAVSVSLLLNGLLAAGVLSIFLDGMRRSKPGSRDARQPM